MIIAAKWQVVGLSRISKINLPALLSALGRLANAVEWRIMVDVQKKAYLPVVAYCLLYICAPGRHGGAWQTVDISIFSRGKGVIWAGYYRSVRNSFYLLSLLI